MLNNDTNFDYNVLCRSDQLWYQRISNNIIKILPI